MKRPQRQTKKNTPFGREKIEGGRNQIPAFIYVHFIYLFSVKTIMVDNSQPWV